MYLKQDHFKQVLAERVPDADKLFHHSERLSSKAMLFSSGDNLAIIYVNTVVFLKVGDKIKLNSNGWTTNTTKKWINKGFDIVGKLANIYQKNWQWYLKENGDVREYQDNMIISSVNA